MVLISKIFVVIKIIRTVHTKCWLFTVICHGINHKMKFYMCKEIYIVKYHPYWGFQQHQQIHQATRMKSDALEGFYTLFMSSQRSGRRH